MFSDFTDFKSFFPKLSLGKMYGDLETRLFNILVSRHTKNSTFQTIDKPERSPPLDFFSSDFDSYFCSDLIPGHKTSYGLASKLNMSMQGSFNHSVFCFNSKIKFRKFFGKNTLAITARTQRLKLHWDFGFYHLLSQLSLDNYKPKYDVLFLNPYAILNTDQTEKKSGLSLGLITSFNENFTANSRMNFNACEGRKWTDWQQKIVLTQKNTLLNFLFRLKYGEHLLFADRCALFAYNDINTHFNIRLSSARPSLTDWKIDSVTTDVVHDLTPQNKIAAQIRLKFREANLYRIIDDFRLGYEKLLDGDSVLKTTVGSKGTIAFSLIHRLSKDLMVQCSFKSSLLLSSYNDPSSLPYDLKFQFIFGMQ